MKTGYETELGKSYMVLDCEKEDSFAVQMLEENHIQSLLPFERRHFNGELQFYYDVTGMCTLTERIQKIPLEAKDIRRILQGLYCVFEEIHSYFLEADRLLLQAEYIYETSQKVFFCYYPSKEAERWGATIELFAENLLDQIDNEDEEALQLAYQFYALVKDAKKGILYILEEILTDEEPVLPSLQMLQEISADEMSVPENEEKTVEKKPDVYIVGCFLLSFLCCLLNFFMLPGLHLVAGIIMALSTAGIILGWTDIDIKRKK